MISCEVHMTLLNYLVSSILILTFSIEVQAKDFALVKTIESRTSIKQVKKICRLKAKESKRNGTSKLIIVFEGLWSLNQRTVNSLQKFRTDIISGKKVDIKLRGRGGYVTKGPLAYLVDNYAKEFDFFVLSHKTEKRRNKSKALLCVLEWNEVFGDELDLNIIGHSFGGYAALYLMHKLDERGLFINNIITIDARAYSKGYKFFYTSENVGILKNYYQKGFLRGYEIKGAVNKRLRGVSHGSISSSEQVFRGADEIFN